MQLVCFQSHFDRIVHLLAEKVRPHVHRKTSQEQTSEDEIWLEIVWIKSEHSVHEV